MLKVNLTESRESSKEQKKAGNCYYSAMKVRKNTIGKSSSNNFQKLAKLIKWAFASFLYVRWYYFGTKMSCAGIESVGQGMIIFFWTSDTIPIGRMLFIRMKQSEIEMVHSG